MLTHTIVRVVLVCIWLETYRSNARIILIQKQQTLEKVRLIDSASDREHLPETVIVDFCDGICVHINTVLVADGFSEFEPRISLLNHDGAALINVAVLDVVAHEEKLYFFFASWYWD